MAQELAQAISVGASRECDCLALVAAATVLCAAQPQHQSALIRAGGVALPLGRGDLSAPAPGGCRYGHDGQYAP